MTIASTVLLAAVPVLVSLYARQWKDQDKNEFLSQKNGLNLPTAETFNFIIVGAGTSGCALATRLSEYFSVLLLEAGGSPPPQVSVPGLAVVISSLPDINYLYSSTVQQNANRQNDGVVSVSAGKMFGGSGSHNYMQWERGHRFDYDHWATLTKDDSWKYSNIVKYFDRIENFQRRSSKQLNVKNTSKNPIQIDIMDASLTPGQNLWFEAIRTLGYDFVNTSPHQSIGPSPVYYTNRRGTRVSSYTAYLKPILKRRQKKLTVMPYSIVSKVIFDGNTATGVEFERHGVPQVAFASKEVILSAGTFISPLILFRSGIGPLDQVREAKAERQIVELPVGRNLMDHPVVFLEPFFLNDSTMTWTLDQNLTFGDIRNLVKNGQGPLSSSFHGSQVFISSQNIGNINRNDWPNLQIYFIPSASVPNAVTCAVSNARPLSRGVLTINSSATSLDDNNPILLDFKYFDNETDFDVTIAGINFCLEVMEKTETFKRVGGRLDQVPYEPCQMHPTRSTEYWKCYIRYKATTGYHYSGTCRMGQGGSQDKDAVVNSKLEVIGVKRLRIVDASIMPQLTTANTFAPTLLIAEKAADTILQKHYRRKSRNN